MKIAIIGAGISGLAAASRIKEINGLNLSWFAGAYLGNGFHEDGVVSGRQVAETINRLSATARFTGPETPVEPAHA